MAKTEPLCLDAGALIAIERDNPRMKALLNRAEAQGADIEVPASVIGQVWRGGARQARLARFLGDDGHTEPALDGPAARAVGAVLASSRTADVVDAHVVLVARQSTATVITSDPDDIRRLDPTLRIRAI